MVIELIDRLYKSREFTNSADLFIREPSQIDELVNIATSDQKYPYPEYSSWLLIHVLKKSPELLTSYQTNLIDCILISKNQSVLRNLINVTVSLPLIEFKESEFLDKLIEFIKDDSNKAALFVYSLYKLIQFTQKYPEIKPEILGILEIKQIHEVQPSIKVAIRNYLKATNHL